MADEKSIVKMNRMIYNILLQGSLNTAMTYKNNITHSFDVTRSMMIHLGQMNFCSATV